MFVHNLAEVKCVFCFETKNDQSKRMLTKSELKITTEKQKKKGKKGKERERKGKKGKERERM